MEHYPVLVHINTVHVVYVVHHHHTIVVETTDTGQMDVKQIHLLNHVHMVVVEVHVKVVVRIMKEIHMTIIKEEQGFSMILQDAETLLKIN